MILERKTLHFKDLTSKNKRVCCIKFITTTIKVGMNEDAPESCALKVLNEISNEGNKVMERYQLLWKDQVYTGTALKVYWRYEVKENIAPFLKNVKK